MRALLPSLALFFLFFFFQRVEVSLCSHNILYSMWNQNAAVIYFEFRILLASETISGTRCKKKTSPRVTAGLTATRRFFGLVPRAK